MKKKNKEISPLEEVIRRFGLKPIKNKEYSKGGYIITNCSGEQKK